MFSRRSLVLVVMYMQRHCVSARGLAMPARRRFQIKYTLSRQAAQLLAGMGGLPMRPLTRAPEHAGRPSARGPLRELGPAVAGGHITGSLPHKKGSSAPAQGPTERSARPDPAGGSCSAVRTKSSLQSDRRGYAAALAAAARRPAFHQPEHLAQTAQSTTPSLSAKPPHIAAMVALASASSADPARRASDRSLRLRRRLACAA